VNEKSGNGEIRVYDFYEAAYYRLNGLQYTLSIEWGTKVVWIFGPEASETQNEYRGGEQVKMSGSRFSECIKETKKEMHYKKDMEKKL